MEAGTGYPKKDFAFALLVMSSGTVLNIIYWGGYELIFLKAGFYEEALSRTLVIFAFRQVHPDWVVPAPSYPSALS